jgi:hypothetical protein
VTDIVLVVAAFALVCVFFRRACHEEFRMWRLLRLALPVIFSLVVGLSALSLSRHYSRLFSLFIVEFSQNLYFTCLVLTTLLYVLLQQLRSVDGELGLLVSGLGIQFAGPAASMALFQLTAGGSFARSLTAHVVPLCSLGMLVVWLYALTQLPESTAVPAASRSRTNLQEVTVSNS